MTDYLCTTHRHKILLVDDESDNIRVLQNLLKDEYEIFFSTNGRSAVEIAERESPDLILLDVMMPGMGGHEVLSRLKAAESTREIPVIFVTSMTDTEDEMEGLLLGAVDYITKPLSPPIVQLRVRTHLELKRQRDLLKEMTFRDGLTGIYNRRYFDEYLDREWRRATRSGLALAVILVDIDHFKAYNDNYGHSAGDDCLRRVAQALDGTVNRAADMVARYGGEEFVCVLPGMKVDGSGAVTVGENMHRRVADLAIPHAHSSAADHVTISLGLAYRVPSLDMQPGELIEAADANLYRAKKAGRNRLFGQ